MLLRTCVGVGVGVDVESNLVESLCVGPRRLCHTRFRSRRRCSVYTRFRNRRRCSVCVRVHGAHVHVRYTHPPCVSPLPHCCNHLQIAAAHL